MKKVIKVVLALSVALLSINGGSSFALATDGVEKAATVSKESSVTMQVEAQLADGRLIVPIRFVTENLGCTVNYDSKTQTVSITGNETSIIMTRNQGSTSYSNIVNVNGVDKNVDVSGKIIGSWTMVPVRFLSENLGYTVMYDNNSNVATIFKPEAHKSIVLTKNSKLAIIHENLTSEEEALLSQEYIDAKNGVVNETTGASLLSDTLTYKIVDTGQTEYFDDKSLLSAVPATGSEYYGQDANYSGNQPSYVLSDDGKTVVDKITGLTWQRSPNLTLTKPAATDKMTLTEAQKYPTKLNSMKYGGYDDWRLPSIKELYSLILFKGGDVGPSQSETDSMTPFIDTNYFMFSYGDTSANERIIDSQYMSSTSFILNPAEGGTQLQFGVNMADGRIKGYGILMPGRNVDKTFFVMCVRGNTGYGKNVFKDNGDGTVTDKATGLMWNANDSGKGMTWKEALLWVQKKNTEKYLGHSDWRLPNAKELQSIVDYDNAPVFNGKPAIDTDFFKCTAIKNEKGKTDYAYYWTGTTHKSSSAMQDSAVYVSFGSALGYDINTGEWIDVHGAGCQRSDPKTSPTPRGKAITVNGITGYYNGPQGDAVRALNFVRLVRDAD